MNLLIIYRPAWTPDMSAEQIDQQERVSFLDWRRKLALYELNYFYNNNNNNNLDYKKSMI